MRKHKHTTTSKYHLCCSNGKVQLPLLKEPPSLLQHLLFDQNYDDSKHFQHNIRLYNIMFAFTSPEMKLDPHIYKSRGPQIIRFQGELCHRIESLLPIPK